MPGMSTGAGVGGKIEKTAPEGRSQRGQGRFNILESYIMGMGWEASIFGRHVDLDDSDLTPLPL